jgi:2-oxoisovalerate dehydrogenase E1 component
VTEPIDDYVVRTLQEWTRSPAAAEARLPGTGGDPGSVNDATLLTYLDSQLASRHLDLAARLLQAEGEGFYTIGSAGHESNAAVALALRPTDPALLHYRSGGFYCARATQVPGVDPVDDILRSLTCSVDDPVSGGRHKVFGSAALSVIPQTSTIASHLPRAVGLAFAVDRGARLGIASPWPRDAVVVTSMGDASVNHSTAAGALNTAGQLGHQGVPLPLLLVVEDNGLGISVRSPVGWVDAVLGSRPGLPLITADGDDPEGVIRAAREAVEYVRTARRPVVFRLRTVRLMGHAGSDAEVGYRSPREIRADYERDPLLAAAALVIGREVLEPAQVLDRYESRRERVRDTALRLRPVRRLSTADEVMRPLTDRRPAAARAAAIAAGPDRDTAFRGSLPENAGALTLAQSLNAALTDLLHARSNALAFGQDVSAKGGVYGVTRGLRKRFGVDRVFDTLLDEQAVLGTALGSALAGFLPVPEIQYLAYLHNAEDQLRGEGATLRFFSDARFENGMVVRIAGLAYQKGFGGHFHNDNSVAVLRDIPGLVLAVPSSAAEAPGLVRALAGLAVAEGRVCVLLEPIALYHARDLHPGDGAWTAAYPAPDRWATCTPRLGECAVHGDGVDVLVVTFGNGVPMSLRAVDAARREADARGVMAPTVTVLDLRWIAPMPVEELLAHASRFARVLVVDETRRSGGVSESVVTALVDGGYSGAVTRVCSADSIVPLGPGADAVLLQEAQITAALLARADRRHA